MIPQGSRLELPGNEYQFRTKKQQHRPKVRNMDILAAWLEKIRGRSRITIEGHIP
jgi:hypothetical protein